jgi:hypothetical protein
MYIYIHMYINTGSPQDRSRSGLLAQLPEDSENSNLGLDIDDYDYDMLMSSTLPDNPLSGEVPGVGGPVTGGGAIQNGSNRYALLAVLYVSHVQDRFFNTPRL